MAAWWERPIGALRGRFTQSEPAIRQSQGNVAEDSGSGSGPVVQRRPDPVEGWRDVPRIQRTLAEPIAPVAINDRFRAGLTTHADPSFVAPLTHQVQPLSGGLVEGLVSSGVPHSHGGPELPVPARPAASPSAPRVQRHIASWPSAADEPAPTPAGPEIQTVPLEFPEPVATGTEDAPITDVVVPHTHGAVVQPSAGSEHPRPIVQRQPAEPASADAPTLGPRLLDAPLADLVPSVPTARVAVPSEPPVQRVTYLAPPIAAAPATRAPEARRSAPVPAVQRATADSAPVPGPAPSAPPTPTGILRSVVDTVSGVFRAPAAQPPPRSVAPTPAARESASDPAAVVQRFPAQDDGLRPAVPAGPSFSSSSRETPVAPTSTPPPPAVQRLPVAGPAPTAASTPRTPTVDTRFPSPAAPGAPAEPAEPSFPILSRETRVPEAGATPSLAEPVPAEPAVPDDGIAAPEPGLEQIPLEPYADGPNVQRSVAADLPAVRRPPTIEPPVIQRDATLNRGAPVAGSAQSAAPSAPAVMPVVQRSAEPEEESPAAHEFASPPPTVQHAPEEVPLGPAVPMEPWTSIETAAPVAAGPGFAAAPGFAADAGFGAGPGRTAEFGSVAGGVSNSRAFSVAAPIAVQRRVAESGERRSPLASAPAPTGSSSAPQQPPLVVSRRAVDSGGPEFGPRPGQGSSFASMFGGSAGLGSDAAAAAEDGYTSVQLSSADGSPLGRKPSVQTAPADESPASAAPSAPAAPSDGAAASAPLPAGAAGGAAGGNLDEMARRLYEPLVARLREELWLDRERAGAMSDL